MNTTQRRVLVLRGEHDIELVPRFGLSIISRLAAKAQQVLADTAGCDAHAADAPRWVLFKGEIPPDATQAICMALGTPCIDVESIGPEALRLRLFAQGVLADERLVGSGALSTTGAKFTEAWKAVVDGPMLGTFPECWPSNSGSYSDQVKQLAKVLGSTEGDLVGTPSSRLREAKSFKSATGLTSAFVPGSTASFK